MPIYEVSITKSYTGEATVIVGAENRLIAGAIAKEQAPLLDYEPFDDSPEYEVQEVRPL